MVKITLTPHGIDQVARVEYSRFPKLRLSIMLWHLMKTYGNAFDEIETTNGEHSMLFIGEFGGVWTKLVTITIEPVTPVTPIKTKDLNLVTHTAL